MGNIAVYWVFTFDNMENDWSTCENAPRTERESVHTYTTPAHSCSGILLFYGQEEKKMGRHTVWWSDEANGKWNVSVELQFPTFYLIGALSPGYFASYLMCVSFRHQYQDFKQIPCYLNVIWMDHSTAASAATYSFVLFFTFKRNIRIHEIQFDSIDFLMWW